MVPVAPEPSGRPIPANVVPQVLELLRTANQMVEAFDLPKATARLQQSIDLAGRVVLPRPAAPLSCPSSGNWTSTCTWLGITTKSETRYWRPSKCSMASATIRESCGRLSTHVAVALVQAVHPGWRKMLVVLLASFTGQKAEQLPPILGQRINFLAAQPSGPLDVPPPQREFRNRIDGSPVNEVHRPGLLPMRQPTVVNVDLLSRIKELKGHCAIVGWRSAEGRPLTPSGPGVMRTLSGE